MFHLIGFIVLGLIAGFIASKIVNKTGSGLMLDTIIGVVGAVIGGFIGDKLGLGGLEGVFSIWSLFLAVVGAIVVLLAYRAVSSR